MYLEDRADIEQPEKSGEYASGFQAALQTYNQQDIDPYLSSLGPLMWYGIPIALAFVLGKRLSSSLTGEGLADMMSPISSRSFRVDVKNVKFADVVGIDEAKNEILQYFKFLKDVPRFRAMGARMPKGCLLSGEPGTGKTLLAKAIACEAGVPFFSCNGADFVEVYGGSGARRVREIFTQARKEMPSVIFIDEIDALGSRDSSRSGGSGEESRTLNQLLAELDGLTQSSSDQIIVFAATNIKSALDKALLREGRFDRKIQIDVPDRASRVELFNFYLKDNFASEPSQQEDSLKELADLTPGFSPATIATVVNEASLAASQQGMSKITKECLLNAIEDSVIGKKKAGVTPKVEVKKRVAYYQAGKAIISWFIPLRAQMNGEILKVSIETRGAKQGFVYRKGKEANEYDTDIKLFHEVCQLLAGKIAEERFCGYSITQGAMQDQSRASKLCLQGLLCFGFQKKPGRISADFNEIGQGQLFVNYSTGRQKEAEDRANDLLQRATERCHAILSAHEDGLKKVVDALVDKTEVFVHDLSAILGPRRE